MRRPPVVLGLAGLTMLALLIALGLILFLVNPGVDRSQSEIDKAVNSQHAIICAQVQNTANAYRFRSLTPSGAVEPVRHFLTRMQAQAQTLRLARGSECRSAPGFPPVGLQVRRALAQINRILMSFEPEQRKPIEQRQTSSFRHQSFSPAFPKPSNTGVGEEGVPAHLHDELGSQRHPHAPQGHSKETPDISSPPEVQKETPSPLPPPIVPVAPEPKPEPVSPPPKPGIKVEIPGLVEGELKIPGPEVVSAEIEADSGT